MSQRKIYSHWRGWRVSGTALHDTCFGNGIRHLQSTRLWQDTPKTSLQTPERAWQVKKALSRTKIKIAVKVVPYRALSKPNDNAQQIGKIHRWNKWKHTTTIMVSKLMWHKKWYNRVALCGGSLIWVWNYSSQLTHFAKIRQCRTYLAWMMMMKLEAWLRSWAHCRRESRGITSAPFLHQLTLMLAFQKVLIS